MAGCIRRLADLRRVLEFKGITERGAQFDAAPRHIECAAPHLQARVSGLKLEQFGLVRRQQAKAQMVFRAVNRDAANALS